MEKLESHKDKPEDEDRTLREQAEFNLGLAFDRDQAKSKIDELVSKVECMPDDKIPFNKNEVVGNLKKVPLEEKGAFMVAIMMAIKPLFAFKKDDPTIFEEVARERILKEGGKTKLSETLYFDSNKDDPSVVQIHLAVAYEFIKQKGIVTFMNTVTEGLNRLAEIIKDNTDLKRITATSWIIYEHPKLIERLGFKISKKVFYDNATEFRTDGKAQLAWISKKDLLKRYGSKK